MSTRIGNKIVSGNNAVHKANVSLDNITSAGKEQIIVHVNENSAELTLPLATESTVGGVKVDGATISITEDGTISANIPEIPDVSNLVTKEDFNTYNNAIQELLLIINGESAPEDTNTDTPSTPDTPTYASLIYDNAMFWAAPATVSSVTISVSEVIDGVEQTPQSYTSEAVGFGRTLPKGTDYYYQGYWDYEEKYVWYNQVTGKTFDPFKIYQDNGDNTPNTTTSVDYYATAHPSSYGSYGNASVFGEHYNIIDVSDYKSDLNYGTLTATNLIYDASTGEYVTRTSKMIPDASGQNIYADSSVTFSNIFEIGKTYKITMTAYTSSKDNGWYVCSDDPVPAYCNPTGETVIHYNESTPLYSEVVTVEKDVVRYIGGSIEPI